MRGTWLWWSGCAEHIALFDAPAATPYRLSDADRSKRCAPSAWQAGGWPVVKNQTKAAATMRTKTKAVKAKTALVEPPMDAATAKLIADHSALMVSPLAPLRSLTTMLDRSPRPSEVDGAALWEAFQDALAPLSLVVHHVRPQEDFTEFCPEHDAFGYDDEDEWLRDYVVELRTARDRLAQADPKHWRGAIAEAREAIRCVLGGLAEHGVDVEPMRSALDGRDLRRSERKPSVIRASILRTMSTSTQSVELTTRRRLRGRIRA